MTVSNSSTNSKLSQTATDGFDAADIVRDQNVYVNVADHADLVTCPNYSRP